MSTTHGRLSRQAANRLQGGELILRGFDNDEIVDFLGVSLSSVKRWRKTVERDGMAALARKPGSGRSSELSSEQLQELKSFLQQGAKAFGYLTDRWTSRIESRSHSQNLERRLLSFQCTENPSRPRFVVSKTRREVDEIFATSRRSLAQVCLASLEKKANDEGLTLSIWDESGFSFVPNRGGTWAPIGETPTLLETPGRHNHTGLGFITRTPVRHLLDFRFTIFEGAARFEDFVFYLAELHHYYGGKSLVLWDHLPAHHAVESYFEDERPDWFAFHYFPTYSPELNPVEQCWNQMKNVYLCNFVPSSDEELKSTVAAAAMKINDEHLLRSFFEHVGISF